MIKAIKVLKASGEYEAFSEEKVRSSLQRAGVDERTREEIFERLKNKLYDGIPTKEIYALVFAFLREKKAHLASRYNLKQAIMELGPSGYPFERFFAGVLGSLGYQTEVNREIEGKCVGHEVDVVALKEDKVSMIECKFHSKAGTKTNVKKSLYVYARFLDLKEQEFNVFGKRKKLDEAWLVTNTKLTSRAITYCRCVGLKAIGWDYPREFSLRLLVEQSNLHPLTCLNSLSSQEKQRILEQGIVFCRELGESEKINFLVPKNKVEQVRQEARSVCRL